MLMVFLITPVVHCAQVTLAWDRNQEDDIAGYRLYYGSSSGNYAQVIDVGNNNQHKVSGLQAGARYYFALTAYDTTDTESAFSKELVHTTGVVTHTIIASAGNNGRITPLGSMTVNQGTNKTFSMHPDQNYQVLNIKVDGVSVGTITKYTFNNITADHTIAASFTYTGPAPVADSDNDSVPDDQDDFPLDPDETTDTDGDGQGNNADTDDDNDGMPDDWEIMHRLNPLKNDAARDPDADGIDNLNEYLGGTEPNIFEDFFKPEAPDLLSPSDEEVESLMPVLQTGAFSDPDPADTHTSSRWQIFRSEDRVCVFDKTSYASRTELVVPKLVLDENTAYEWRVKFVDNHGLSSEWSESVTFTTDYNAADANGNGIPDHQEVEPTLDLDEDGTPDNDQSNIKCAGVEGESTQIGISIRDAEAVQSIAAVETENPADLPTDTPFFDRTADLPFGLISFKLIVSQPGDEVVVTLHLSRAASQDGIWYKYDPVDDIWYDYAAYTEFSADRKRVYLTLSDGGFGDADGIMNGIIVDPLGISDPSSPPAAATDTVEDAGGGGGAGGGSGCFIFATAYDLKTNSLYYGIWDKSRELAFALMILFLLFALRKFQARITRP